MARTHSFAGRFASSRRPIFAAEGLRSFEGDRPRPRGVEGVERASPRVARLGTRYPDDGRGLGQRADLEGHLGDDPEGAHRAGQELGEVVARDVLDDPAAALDLDPLRRDEADADDLVARAAEAEPPRAAGVGGEDAAERRSIGLRDIDQQPLILLRQDRAERGRGDPGLDA